MGREKLLKNEILENQLTNPQWKLLYFLCEEYGWELVQIFGWLIAIGHVGITNLQLQKILNLQKNKYEKIIRKLAKEGLIERVRFIRQKSVRGIRLDWDELVDKYGQFARYAQKNTIVCFNSDENDSQVPPCPPANSDHENAHSMKLNPDRPTEKNFDSVDFVIFNLIGDWSEDEISQFQTHVCQMMDEKKWICTVNAEEKQLVPKDTSSINLSTEKIGTEFVTRARSSSPRARATMYIKSYYINIIKKI